MAWLRIAGVITGEVVEWLMAPVLKTGDPQGSVGSNPTLSVLEWASPPPVGCDPRTDPDWPIHRCLFHRLQRRLDGLRDRSGCQAHD